MKHTDIKEIFDSPKFGEEVTVCGWVRTSRDSKNVAFIELNDGTSLKHLQIVLDKAEASAFPDEALKLGTSLKVVGKVVEGREGVPVYDEGRNGARHRSGAVRRQRFHYLT